jgi:diguanylate cyclase (GGDEF)-like protein
VKDEAAPVVSLLDAARVVARGGGLDQKLVALAEQARMVSGARTVTLHLLDPDTARLVPIAVAGDAPSTVDIGLDDTPAVADILVRQEPAFLPPEGLAWIPADTAGGALVPLVATEEQGAAQVEGLLTWVATEQVDRFPDALLAVADLAAVAIRASRLEQTLLERADWAERVTNTDPVTGLANRRTFEQMLQLELVRASRQRTALSVALFVIDGLDGAASGPLDVRDEALRRVAATLAQELRLVDTVARYGEDRFAAICPGAEGPQAALRVRDAVAALQPAPGSGDRPLSVSAGIAARPSDGAAEGTEAVEGDPTLLLEAAEAALEAARAQGPGSVVGPQPTA